MPVISIYLFTVRGVTLLLYQPLHPPLPITVPYIQHQRNPNTRRHHNQPPPVFLAPLPPRPFGTLGVEFPFCVFDGERVRDESGTLFSDGRWHSRGWDVKRNSVSTHEQSEYANRNTPIGICQSEYAMVNNEATGHNSLPRTDTTV